jgi:hypothetical protein
LGQFEGNIVKIGYKIHSSKIQNDVDDIRGVYDQEKDHKSGHHALRESQYTRENNPVNFVPWICFVEPRKGFYGCNNVLQGRVRENTVGKQGHDLSGFRHIIVV